MCGCAAAGDMGAGTHTTGLDVVDFDLWGCVTRAAGTLRRRDHERSNGRRWVCGDGDYGGISETKIGGDKVSGWLFVI